MLDGESQCRGKSGMGRRWGILLLLAVTLVAGVSALPATTSTTLAAPHQTAPRQATSFQTLAPV